MLYTNYSLIFLTKRKINSTLFVIFSDNFSIIIYMKMQKNKKEKTGHNSKSTRTIAVVLLIAFVSIIAFYFLNQPKQPERTYTTEKQPPTMKNDYTFTKQGELVFTTTDGDSLAKIDIEFADTNDKRTLGLMFREEMKKYEGMLFIFPFEEPQSFWMANTKIPLDIIYVNSKREIVKIQKNTTPFSRQSYPSFEPAIFVVEVNAGFTEEHNIKEGDKIFWIRTN